MLDPATTCWVLTDGKIGDLVQCAGVAERLGVTHEQRVIHPRPPWSWLAPRGPVDPREGLNAPNGPLRGPLPEIVIASGRRAVPYLRAIKQGSQGRSFTVFLKDPYLGTGAADVIWVPEHDRLRGRNVIVTLTSPNTLTPERLAEARKNPDPRLGVLPAPRTALMLGGPNSHFKYPEADGQRLAELAETVLGFGMSLMISPSRRTPAHVVASLRAVAARHSQTCFLWDGTGSNPYTAMLGLADAVIVTADSANMVGEAAMTGRPLHIFQPSGRHAKMGRFVDRLIALGVARPWAGKLGAYAYEPVDATPYIARQVAERYRAFRTAGPG